MKITTKFITQNPYYKAGRYIKVKGLMLHSIGTPQPNPWKIYDYWNDPDYDTACVNGFIGANEIIIAMPCLEKRGEAMRGPHAGKRATNDTFIGFEMCEPKQIKYVGGSTFTCSDKKAAAEFVKTVTANAVELFAKLCTFHGLDPMTDIISHAEGYKKGMASNHGDPDHLWRQLGMNYNMDSFRADVKKAMGGSAVSVPTPSTPANNPIKVGDVVKITAGASYCTGKKIPSWVVAKQWIVRKVTGDEIVIDKSADGKNAICSPVHSKYLTVVKSAATIEVGDKVRVKSGVTKYANGKTMASWVRTATLYVRRFEQNGKVYLVSTEPVKEVYTGRVNASDVEKI